MHADLGAVIGTSGESDLEMQIIGEDGLFNPLCKCGGVVAGVRTYTVSNAGTYISGAGGRITCAWVSLVDVQPFYNGLKHLIDFGHIRIVYAGDLKSLPVGNVYRSVAVLLCDILYHGQITGIHMAAWHTDTGGCFAALFCDAECIFL